MPKSHAVTAAKSTSAWKLTIKGEHPSISDIVIEVTGIGVVVTDTASVELQVLAPVTVSSILEVPEVIRGQKLKSLPLEYSTPSKDQSKTTVLEG